MVYQTISEIPRKVHSTILILTLNITQAYLKEEAISTASLKFGMESNLG